MTCNRCRNSLSLEERARVAVRTNLCLGDRARIASERIMPLDPDVKKVWVDTLPTHLQARLALGQDIYKPAINVDRNNLQARYNSTFNDSGFLDETYTTGTGANISKGGFLIVKEDGFSKPFVRQDFLSEEQLSTTLRANQLELEVKGLISRVREVKEESRGLEDLYTTLVHYRARKALDAPPGRSSRYIHQGVLRCKHCGIVNKDKPRYEGPQDVRRNKKELFQQLPLEVRVALALGKGNSSDFDSVGEFGCGIEGCDYYGEQKETPITKGGIGENNPRKRGNGKGHCSHCGQDLPRSPPFSSPTTQGNHTPSNGNQPRINNSNTHTWSKEHDKANQGNGIIKIPSHKSEVRSPGILQDYPQVHPNQDSEPQLHQQSLNQSHFYLHKEDNQTARYSDSNIPTNDYDHDRPTQPIPTTQTDLNTKTYHPGRVLPLLVDKKDENITFLRLESHQETLQGQETHFQEGSSQPIERNQYTGRVLPLLVDRKEDDISISRLETYGEPISQPKMLQHQEISFQEDSSPAVMGKQYSGSVLPLLVDKEEEHITISRLETHDDTISQPRTLQRQDISFQEDSSPPVMDRQYSGSVLPLLVDKKEEHITISRLETYDDPISQPRILQRQEISFQEDSSPPVMDRQYSGSVLPLLVDKKEEHITISRLETYDDPISQPRSLQRQETNLQEEDMSPRTDTYQHPGRTLPLLVDKKRENISFSRLDTYDDTTPPAQSPPIKDPISPAMSPKSDPEEAEVGGDGGKEDIHSVSYSEDVSQSPSLASKGSDLSMDRSISESLRGLSHDSLGSSVSDDDW